MPTGRLLRGSWLDERSRVGRSLHFNDEEIWRLGRAGIGVCHCPTSNMMLSSGQCRTKDLEAAGSPIGLGVDGSHRTTVQI
jgi:8-oxoguanine deaminase